ncbi:MULTISPECIES: phage tail tape measure protein [Clostridium]|uniref:Phage tail tape measure protein n=1 Tax=Clostridium frigoriphilum TaxID=443253 RepID=A0ABU7UQ19_9CLOT|nr:phage tail tape measure protein [Clostridium sp. DSM 17811]MBU3100660.1 phage tail tape measure protein [Clostridium sp. DSM 17811]
MAADNNTVVARIGLDDKGFQDGVAKIQRGLKLVQSEFAAASSKLGDFGKSTEALKLKTDTLSKQIEIQKDKVAALNKCFEESVEKKGADAKATENLNIKLNYAIADLNKMQNELKQTTEELDTKSSAWYKLSQSMDKAGEKMKAVGEKVSSVGTKLSATVTLPLLGIGTAATKMAMDAVESENLFEVAMGAMAGDARKWSEDTSKALGLNAYNVRKNVATYNSMLTSMGLTGQESLKMSEGLTQLSYDMASFYNLKPEEAFEKLKSGISGEAEPLKALGILVNDTTIKTYAYSNGIAKQGAQLTEAQKVQARYGAIMQATSKAQGDLGRTLDSPTNKLRIMKEQAEQIGIQLGQILIPILEKVIAVIKPLMDKFQGLSKEQQESVIKIGLIVAAIGPIILIVGKVITIIGTLSTIISAVSGFMATAGGMAGVLGTAFTFLTGPVGIAIAIIAGLIAIGVLLYKNWDTIKNSVSQIWQVLSVSIAGSVDTIKNAIVSTWQTIRSTVLPIVEGIASVIKTIWEGVKIGFVFLWEVIKTIFISAWTIISSVVQTYINIVTAVISVAWQLIQLVTTTVWNVISGVISAIWNGIVAFLNPIIQGIVNFVTGSWNNIKAITNTVFNAVYSVISTVWNSIVNFITPILNSIVGALTTAWNTIKATTTTVWKAIEVVLSTVWDGMKNTTTAVWNSLSEFFSTMWGGVTSLFTSTVNGIKNTVSNVWNSILGVTTTVWNNIKSAIMSPITAAVNFVRDEISKIKSFFSGLNITLPHIKLPHFSLQGEFSLSPPKVPQLGVNWYAKGGIFNSPSVIGVGEAGTEAVLPIDKLDELMARAIEKSNTKTKSSGGFTLHIQNFYNNTDKDIEQLAYELGFYSQRVSLAKGGA